MSANRKPHVELQLVEYLERLYPNRCPAMSDSEREIFAAGGAQRVITKLRAIANEQAGIVLDQFDNGDDDDDGSAGDDTE
jgi:hypothetical protein